MNSNLASRLLLALGVAGALPACGNINDGHPPVPFTILASVSTAGALSDQVCEPVAISGNGRYVVFTSRATTLVSPPASGKNIFRRDLLTGITQLVTIGVGGVPANNESDNPVISFDGRWVAFQSLASNLVVGPVPGLQVYRRDMDATSGTGIVMVSEASPGAPGIGFSQQPSISADGRFVAFSSTATNFGDSHTNTVANIYRRDMNNSTIIPISVNTSGGDPTKGLGPDGNIHPSISADGSRIAYESDCPDLVAFDVNDLSDVFIATVGPPIVTVIASPGLLGGGTGVSEIPVISGDGQLVAFQSKALEFVASDTNLDAYDVFVFDVAAGKVTIASVNAAGFQGSVAEESKAPSISSDGRFVAFQSTSSNLVLPDPNNQGSNIFIKDMRTGAVTRASVATSGISTGLNQNSFFPSLSADARSVAFISEAPLVNGDVNGLKDVYVRSPLR
jgi:Tol biopolymer transport system component